jgi:hypothetical protein
MLLRAYTLVKLEIYMCIYLFKASRQASQLLKVATERFFPFKEPFL